MRRADSLENALLLGNTEVKRRRGQQRIDGWVASLTQWTWVWAKSGREWRAGKPGVLPCKGLQRVRRDLATKQQQREKRVKCIFLINPFFYWRIIALQNFAVLCQTSAWVSHRFTYTPSHWKLPPIPLPTPPSRLIQGPCLSFLSHTATSPWPSILHMVM